MEKLDFKDYLINNDSSSLTIEAYIQDIDLFSKWFEQTNGIPLTPMELTSTDIREYKQYLFIQKQFRPATINRKLASIRVYTKWAIETRQISFNPASGVKSVEEQQLSPKWLSKQEQASLLREAERQVMASHTPARLFEAKRNRSLLIFMLNTGLRLNEVCSLALKDVEVSERKGLATIRKGKGGKTRMVPLNYSARKAISDWLTIRPQNKGDELFIGLKSRAVQEAIKELGTRVKIEVTPHTLRHTFAKNLIDTKQVSLDKVGMLCGHSSLNSTKIYTVASIKDLQDSVGFLDG